MFRRRLLRYASHFGLVLLAAVYSTGTSSGESSSPPAPGSHAAARPWKPVQRVESLLRDRASFPPHLLDAIRLSHRRLLAMPRVEDFKLWEPVGPTSIHDGQIGLTGHARDVTGRVIAIKASPCSHRDLWLLGAAAGGPWRSADRGRTWQVGIQIPSSQSGPPSLSIGALAFEPPSRCPALLAYAGTGDPTSRTDSYSGTGLFVSEDGGKIWRPLRTTWVVKGKLQKINWFGTAVTAIVTTPAPGGGHYLWVGTRPAHLTFHEGSAASSNFIGLFRAHVDSSSLPSSFVVFDQVMDDVISDLKSDPDDLRCVYIGSYREPSEHFGASHLCPGDAQPRHIIYAEFESRVVKLAPALDGALYISAFNPRGVVVDPRQALALIRLNRSDFQAPDGTWKGPVEWDFTTLPLISFEPDPSSSYCQWDPASPYPSRPDGCVYFNVLSASPTEPFTLYAGGIALWRCRSCKPGTRPEWEDISYLTPRPRSRGTQGTPPSWMSPWHGIHQDQQALEWVAENSPTGYRLVVANDGGVWSRIEPEATDKARRWDNHNFGGLAITQIYRGGLDRRRPEVVFIGTQDVGTARFDGSRWYWIHGGDGVGAAVGYRDAALRWAVAQQSSLVQRDSSSMLSITRTLDGGLTYQRADLGIELETRQWVPPFVQCPSRDADVILFGDRGLWKAEDLLTVPTIRPFENASPPAWRRNYPSRLRPTDRDPTDDITAVAIRSDPDPKHAAAAARKPCDTYVFADLMGRVLLTRDGGDAWPPIVPKLPAPPVRALAFSPGEPLTIYAATALYAPEPGHIWRWTDGDRKWKNVTPSYQGRRLHLPFNAVAPLRTSNAPEAVFAGSDFGIWISPHRGDSDSWCLMRIDADTPYPPVMDLKVHPLTNWVYAFTFGRGVFRLKKADKAVEACLAAHRRHGGK